MSEIKLFHETVQANRDLMFDIETGGTVPGSVIFEIGVVSFDRYNPEDTFTAWQFFPSIRDQLNNRMFFTQEAIHWHIKQAESGNKESRQYLRCIELREELDDRYQSVTTVVNSLKHLLTFVGEHNNIYCRGASFDFPCLAILGFFDSRTDIFKDTFRKQLCVRTIEEEGLRILSHREQKKYRDEKERNDHSAIGDCINQVRNLNLMDKLLIEK